MNHLKHIVPYGLYHPVTMHAVGRVGINSLWQKCLIYFLLFLISISFLAWNRRLGLIPPPPLISPLCAFHRAQWTGRLLPPIYLSRPLTLPLWLHRCVKGGLGSSWAPPPIKVAWGVTNPNLDHLHACMHPYPDHHLHACTLT